MIRYADLSDFDTLIQHDVHICAAELQNSIRQRRVLVMYDRERFVGWLRFNLFWDNTPFMNMLYLLEEYRNNGCGTQLVAFWENAMRQSGYNMVLTSTQSNEDAQFFYRKRGYTDCGALMLPQEPAEIMFYKKLK